MLSRIKQNLKKPKVMILMAILFALVLWFILCLPKPLFSSPTSFVIDDDAGQLLGASIAADGQWRFPYNAEVPEKFTKMYNSF
jgi:penicillin-binding protein 1C